MQIRGQKMQREHLSGCERAPIEALRVAVLQRNSDIKGRDCKLEVLSPPPLTLVVQRYNPELLGTFSSRQAGVKLL